MYKELADLIAGVKKLVVVVANNPDADSLGSALALREILQISQKEVTLYCRVEIPFYLRFLDGWQDFSKELGEFELAIMVDNSALKLLEIERTDISQHFRQKPFVILDHHSSQPNIDFATLIYNEPQMAATGQLIYEIAKELNWPLNKEIAYYLASSILSDSLGFTSQIMLDNPAPLRIMAELVDLGVDLSFLAQKRLSWQEIPAEMITYKGELLQRIEFHAQNQIASLSVEHEEIKRMGSQFNPTIVLDEMRLVENVRLSLGFKKYQNPSGQLTRVTLRIRCHKGAKLAQNLAEHFEGGGHPYAAGVKWEGGDLDFNEIKKLVLEKAISLL